MGLLTARYGFTRDSRASEMPENIIKTLTIVGLGAGALLTITTDIGAFTFGEYMKALGWIRDKLKEWGSWIALFIGIGLGGIMK